MATLFAVNYDGLRPKGSYEEIIDKLAAGRPELRQPDRQAKFLRESPQIANLLDGEGSLSFLEMAQQQLAAASHQAVEQRVLEVASEPGAAPAQALRAAFTQTTAPATSSVRTQAGADSADRFSQTRGPTLADTGTQAFRAQTRSGGVQTEQSGSTQFFDIDMDQRMEEDLQDLNAALDAQNASDDRQRQNIAAIIARHLGEEITSQQPFAARIASASGASSSAAPAAITPAQASPTVMETEPSGAKRPAGSSQEGSAAESKAAKASPTSTKRTAGTNGGNGNVGRPQAKQRVNPAEQASEAPALVGLEPPSSGAPPHPPRRGGATEGREAGERSSQAKGPPPSQPASSSDDVLAGDRHQHGLKPIEGKNETWWRRQNIATIKAQAELRGHRFSDLDTKGGRTRVMGKWTRVPKFKKEDYLRVLFGQLGL